MRLGIIPEYTKTTPIKPDSTKEQYYDYDFSGWDRQITTTVADTTYIAQYNKKHQTYHVTYYDEGKTKILEEKDVNRGEEAKYGGETPIKSEKDGKQFRFSGWTKIGEQESGKVDFIANYDSAVKGLQVSNFKVEEGGVEKEYGMVTGYDGIETNVEVPEEFGGVKITKICEGAFSPKNNDVSLIASIKLPNTIDTIEEGAFLNLTNLKSVTLPTNDKFTSISDLLFYNCSKITDITIPDSVTEIGSKSFDKCTSLSHIKIGAGVNKFNDDFFEGCTSLTSVDLDGNKTFKTDSTKQLILNTAQIEGEEPIPEDFILIRCLPGVNATKLSAPENTRIITKFAFKNCTKINEVDLNKVIRIDEGAFSGCGMTAFDTGDNVTELGAKIFDNCNNLASIIIGKGLKTIDPTALVGCNNLSSITIGAGGNVNYSAENGILYDSGKTELIRCPEGLSDIKITESNTLETIGANAFQNCTMSSLSMPSNIKTIKEKAFLNCKNLTNLTIGDAVESIGGFVIQGTKVETVKLGKAIKYGGLNLACLVGCDYLKKIDVNTANETLMSYNDGILCEKDASGKPTIIHRCPSNYNFGDDNAFVVPETVTKINQYAFKDSAFLTHITIHDNLKEIDTNVFNNTKLTTIKLNKGTFIINEESMIDANAFDGCTNLNKLEFTKIEKTTTNKVIERFSEITKKHFNINVLSDDTTISAQIFSGNASIETIKLKEGVTKIDNSAFSTCTNLTSISLPTTITEIGDCAFENCYKLNEFPLISNVTKIGTSAFHNCIALTDLNLSSASNLKEIGKNAFYQNKFKSLTFNSSLTTIKDAAFADNLSLKGEITLNEGLKTLGARAFTNNSSITGIVIPSTINEYGDLGLECFAGCGSLESIKYSGTFDAWKTIYKKANNVFKGAPATKVNCNGDIHYLSECD